MKIQGGVKQFFFFLAVAGWLAGLSVHIMSLCRIDAQSYFPYVWILHVLIFAVWLPAILSLKQDPEASQLNRQSNPFVFFRILFRNTPWWLIALTLAGFIYSFINFMLFAATVTGQPGIKNGQYIMQEKGRLLGVITEAEYHVQRALHLRGFSGHWIAFYGMAAAVLYPFKKVKA